MNYADIALKILFVIGVIAALVPFGLGVLVLVSIIRPQKAPADSSNRINKVRLIWFALTREDKFVVLFPWLRKDEWENLYGTGETQIAVNGFQEVDVNPGLSD